MTFSEADHDRVPEAPARVEAADDEREVPAVEEARDALELIRDDAFRLANRLEGDIVSVSEARQSSNVDDEHDPEGATIAYERSQLEAIRRSAEARAAEATAALERLEAGTYGTCVNCGRPVEPGRLAARPMAAFCLTCAL